MCSISGFTKSGETVQAEEKKKTEATLPPPFFEPLVWVISDVKKKKEKYSNTQHKKDFKM